MREKTCPICGALYRPLRSDRRTCSGACKKALQRGGLKPAGWSGRGRPSSRRRSVAPAPNGDIFGVWPHGVLVEFRETQYALAKPGRVNWHSKAGDQIRAWLRGSPDSQLVPVEDLTGVRIVAAAFVRRASGS